MPLDEASASAAAWLAVAEEDLAVAALILREGRSAGMASFHAQQAGEKALKAYLAWLGHSPIPRTHDLAALAELAVAAGGQLLPEEALTLLSPYAVAARYPVVEPVSLAEAQAALQAATRLVKAVQERIEPG